MKKLTLSTIAVAAAVVTPMASQAQGVIGFSSSAGGSCIVSNTLTGATSKITAGNFTFGLYVSTTLAGLSSTTPVMTVNSTGFAGVISGSNFTVAGLTAGTTYFDEVKGWSNDGATSYEAFAANPGANNSGLIADGVSAIGSISPIAVGSSSPVPGVFGTGAGQISDPVLLTPVPEPSTIALAGLGVAGLLAIRRRK